MSEISPDNRLVARAVAAAFGGNPRVNRYRDESLERHVDVLRADERPQKGVTSWATLGLSDAPLYQDGVEYPARVELVGACESSFKEFGNVLATAAFNIIKDRWFCAPGVTFPDVVAMYRKKGTMRHLLLQPPFLWEGALETLRLESKTVAWLMAIPISEAELRYSEEKGSEALQALFEREQIDVFAIDRRSVL